MNYELYTARTRLLLGDDAAKNIESKRVIIFGVGGVGSWCAEALVRSGVSHLTIVDFDRVCESNVNRQLMATTLTVGRVKVDAMRERLLSINPEADITTRHEAFTADTETSFALDTYDYIIDAIDSVPDKMRLILAACRTRAVLFSSMGAARKLDPTRIEVAEFWKVRGCPLAKALRQAFKKSGQRPGRKFRCVFSEELLANRGTGREPRANGSMVHITAIFGMTIAGLVINDIARRQPVPEP